MSENETPAPVPARPLLRVVSGDPSPAELAALVAVLAARSAGSPEASQTLRSEWNNPARLVRREHRFGPGVWQRSAFGR